MKNQRFHLSAAALLASTMLVGACASPPNLGARPEMAAADSFVSAQSLAGSNAAWPQGQWWTGFGDAQLSALIEEAMAGAPDLAVARARLLAAQGYAQQAGAALLPGADVNGRAELAKQSYNNGFPRAFLPQGWNDTGSVSGSLSLDLDLWGRNRAALAAARSDVLAAQYERAEAQLVLSTGIASAYADLARLFNERDVRQSALVVREETLKLVSGRVAAGLDNRSELKQAEAAVPAARADLAATDEAIALTRNGIAALMGKGPDRGLAIARPRISGRAIAGLPQDVPVNLVGRRPDIAAARARVEAAGRRIDAAKADFLPNISLGALVGFQSLGLDNLVKGGSLMGNVGPAVSLPIFHGGELSGKYRVARATYDEAVADYDRTLIGALRDAADAAASHRMLAQRLDQAGQALADSEQAYFLARTRYEGGLSTYLDVLTAEERMLQYRLAFADLQSRAAVVDVSLIRALGGGFS